MEGRWRGGEGDEWPVRSRLLVSPEERCLEWVGTAGTGVAKSESDVEGENQFVAC